MTDPEDPEDRDPGLARERTSLAWTRTAISFAAVAGVVLKTHPIPGLVLMIVAPAIWQLGRLSHRPEDPRAHRTGTRDVPLLHTLAGRLRLVTATVVAVALVALAVAVS
jgi:uncharacterized membrane protein YidH (DUF202 family)